MLRQNSPRIQTPQAVLSQDPVVDVIKKQNEIKVKDPAKTEEVKADDGGVKKKGEITITKLKREDKKLAQLITLLRSRKKKEYDNQIIVEGNQLIKEAIQAHIKLNKLLFSDAMKLMEITNVMGKKAKEGVEFIKVPQSELSLYSVLQTCPGLIGIFDKPELPEIKQGAININLVCDNVRDPSNLGSLIRVANALPIRMMILNAGSVDPWDTKTIRGSSGSVFHLPIRTRVGWDKIDINTDMDEVVLLADNNIRKYDDDKVINYDQIPKELVKDKNVTVIIGGETHGISEEAFAFAAKRDYRVVNIPLDRSVNSLNVSTALGIILFELRRLMA